jgi:hypothetical protein
VEGVRGRPKEKRKKGKRKTIKRIVFHRRAKCSIGNSIRRLHGSLAGVGETGSVRRARRASATTEREREREGGWEGGEAQTHVHTCEVGDTRPRTGRRPIDAEKSEKRQEGEEAFRFFPFFIRCAQLQPHACNTWFAAGGLFALFPRPLFFSAASPTSTGGGLMNSRCVIGCGVSAGGDVATLAPAPPFRPRALRKIRGFLSLAPPSQLKS